MLPCKTWRPIVLFLVLLAAAGAASAAQIFNFNCGQQYLSVPTGTSHQFRALISAIPPGADSVDVLFTPHVPDGWSAQWCQSSTGSCFISDHAIRLSVGTLDTLEIDLYPVPGTPGKGWVDLKVRARADTLDYAVCSYTLFSGMSVPSVNFTVNCQDNLREVPVAQPVQFKTPIRNNAGFADSLYVTYYTSMPPTWQAQYCQVSTGSCFLGPGTLPLASAVWDTVEVDIWPAGSSGRGFVDLAYHSTANPSMMTFCHYQVFLNQGTTGAPEPQVVMTETRSWAEPNPFHSGTTLRWQARTGGTAEVGIYGADGRLVRALPGLAFEPGVAQARWDGRGDDGTLLPSGVYFYRVRSEGTTIKGMLVRTR